jgi:AcrR family transcriptional regulator
VGQGPATAAGRVGQSRLESHSATGMLKTWPTPPMLPMDSTEPTDPIESTEPTEKAEKAERAEKAEPALAKDAALKAEAAEKAEVRLAQLKSDRALAAEAWEPVEELGRLRCEVTVVVVIGGSLRGCLTLTSATVARLLDTVKQSREAGSMSTNEDRGSDLREALLSAARAELAEGGSAAVSLRAVARRAGVSHAAPGYAFGDRARLLTAVAAQGFRQLAAAMDEPPAPPGQAGLAELGRRYVGFARADPALYELMFRSGELVDGDGELEAARAASLRALTRLTRPDGAEQPPSEMTLISWAVAHGAASLTVQGALPPTTAEALVAGFASLALP